jgi:hypothetical protein
MPLPLVGVGLAAVARYLAKNGITQAVKKYGNKAVKAATDAERGVASKIGSKEGLDVIPGTSIMNRGRGFGLKQKSGEGAKPSNVGSPMATKTKKPSNLAPPMATKAQRAKNVRSGRQRMYGGVGAGLTGAATIPSLMPSEGDKWDENEAGRTKATTPKATTPKATTPKTTTPTGTSKATPTTPTVEYKSSFPKAEKKNWEDYNSIAEAKKAGSLYYSKNGKPMAAVFKEDLAEGETLRDYMNQQIKKDKARDAARGGIANMGPPMEVSLKDDMKAGGKVRGMNYGGKVRGMNYGGKVRGMNYGGKVEGMNYGGKVEGMKSGGKVRGAGIARNGTRACKIR